jgi:hypothetical protein
MDDRDFMDMMYQGMTKTTHAETAYWGFEPDLSERGFDIFYVDQSAPDEKQILGWVEHEVDAAFITAVHGAFPDIHRRWLMALDEAEQKDAEKDEAESTAADLSERLGAYEARYGIEDWHGKASGS